MKSKIWVRLISVLLIGGCTGVYVKEETKPDGAPGVVKILLEKLGRQNDGGLLRIFEDDATVEIAGLGVVVNGQKDLRSFFEYARAVNARLSMYKPEIRKETVFCQLEEKNDWLRRAEVDAAIYQAFFVFKGRRIARIVINPSESTRVVFLKRALPFWKWLESEAPDAIEQLMPNGKFRFSARNGRRLVELISRWRGLN